MSHRSAEPDEITSPPRSRGSFVIVEQAAEPRTPTNPADDADGSSKSASGSVDVLFLPVFLDDRRLLPFTPF